MKSRVGWTLFGALSVVVAFTGLANSGLLVPLAAAQPPGQGPAPGPPQAASPEDSDSELASYVTISGSMLLVESPDHSAIWAYIGSTGRWAKLSLRPNAAGWTKFVKAEYAMIETEDTIYTFSKQAGDWSSLERKPGAKFAWIKRTDQMAIASMGSWVYVLNPKTGTWSSVDLLGQ